MNAIIYEITFPMVDTGVGEALSSTKDDTTRL